MIGGKIQSWKDEGETVLFTIRGTGCEKNDLLDVRGKPEPAMEKLIEVGKDLWWHSNTIFISIFETEDVKMPKVGYSHNHRHVPASDRQ